MWERCGGREEGWRGRGVVNDVTSSEKQYRERERELGVGGVEGQRVGRVPSNLTL